MADVNERIERLITRRLDDELSADERLELDRALLQDPEARALLEEYERVDAAASVALASTVAKESETVAPFPRISSQPVRSGYNRAWWALPAAVAAAVALLVVFKGPGSPGPQLVDQETGPALEQTQLQPDPTRMPEGYSPVRQTGYGTNLERSTDRDLLYILGTDGNVYVIEQERIRTARTPNAAVRPASADF